jgi:Tfp pilus assembly protein PilP
MRGVPCRLFAAIVCIAEVTETCVRLNEHVEDGSGSGAERVASLNSVEDTTTN